MAKKKAVNEEELIEDVKVPAIAPVPTVYVKRFKFEAYHRLLLLEGREPGLIVNRRSPEMILKSETKAQRESEGYRQVAGNRSRYLRDDNDVFITAGIKRCIQTAGYRFAGMNKRVINGIIRIPSEFLTLDISEPYQIRDDVIRNWNKSGNCAVAYRAWYPEWRIEVPVIYWMNQIDHDDVIDLFRIAGQCIGLGAWRIENNGAFGGFEVVGLSEPMLYNRWENRNHDAAA